MVPPLDIRLAIHPLPVAHRQIQHLEIALRRSEDQIVVSKRVEIAEVRAIGGDDLIVGYRGIACSICA